MVISVGADVIVYVDYDLYESECIRLIDNRKGSPVTRIKLVAGFVLFFRDIMWKSIPKECIINI